MAYFADRSWFSFEFASMTLPFILLCEPPLLIVRFDAPQQTLGWCMTHPGFSEARQFVWLEVRNKDLSPGVDPIALLRQNLRERDLADAAAFMTSRDIRRHHVAQSTVGAATATCVATVGLSNGECVGLRRARAADAFGTINTFAHVSKPLSAGAFVEAVSIVAEARTAAVIATSALRSGPPITGTGTDCIVVAAPSAGSPDFFAGLHTELGEALGAAVFAAVHEGASVWSAEVAGGMPVVPQPGQARGSPRSPK